MKTRVYFYQRPNHRLRQGETVNYCPSKLDNRSSMASFTRDLNIPRTSQNPLKKITIGLLQKFMAINFRPIPKVSEDCDLICTWRVIPMNSKRPFIIEIDKPSVLSFYNCRTFQLFRSFFKKALLSPNCHKIICMSIISTRTYGIPEMCFDGYSEYCLKNPLILEDSYASFANPNRQHIEQFVKNDLKYCPDFMEDISPTLIICKENISKFRASSRSLFREKSSPKIRDQNFLELFES